MRLTSLQSKLIIPYVLLTLILAVIGIFIVTRLVTATIRERFVNQVYETARVSSDAIIRQEQKNLQNLRLVTYTEGVPEVLAEENSVALEDLVFPLIKANDIDSVILVNPVGIEVLTLWKELSPEQYRRSENTDLSAEELVQKTLAGVPDEIGDKYVGLMNTTYGPTLFTGAPVVDENGNVLGAVLVGEYLDEMLTTTKEQALADLVVFDKDKKVLAATLPNSEESYKNLEKTIQSTNSENLAKTHDLKLFNRDFQITFTDFLARGEQLGWLGIILPSSYVVAAETTSRDTFSLLFGIGTIAVIIIGYLLSQSIAKPILKLRSFTQAIATGDLEQNVGLKRSDEIGELAEAFDVMTMRLRERTAEANRLYDEAVQRNLELAETNERLRSAQQQLVQSEKLAAIGQLTAGIVHDVKNPLAVIKGVAEFMLNEDDLPADKKQEIALIRESALKANNIISDLLKFARQSKPEMGEHDMRETVEAALRLTAYPLRKAHVQVVKDLPETALVMTYDDQQIEQVLVNLIHNAVQAMPEGGTLCVNLSQSDGNVAITVQDTGVGIPPENINRIFDPFFTTKPEGEGTGLGLSVSYGMVSNHSGRIEVESKVSQGTTFMVFLPVQPPEIMEEQP